MAATCALQMVDRPCWVAGPYHHYSDHGGRQSAKAAQTSNILCGDVHTTKQIDDMRLTTKQTDSLTNGGQAVLGSQPEPPLLVMWLGRAGEPAETSIICIMVDRPCWVASPTTISTTVVWPCWGASPNQHYLYYGGQAVLCSQPDQQ